MVLEDLEDLMESVAKGCRHYSPPPARGTPAARLRALSGHVNARRQANTPSANCYTCTRACHVASGVEVADELTAEVIYGDDTDVASGPDRWRSKQKFFEWKQFLPEEEARAVVELAQKFGVWHMHSEGEVLSIGYGAGEGVASLNGVDVPDPATLGTKHFPGEPGPGGRVLNEDGTEWIFPHRFDMGVCLGPLRDADGMLYGRPNDKKGTSRTNFFRESFMYGVAGDPGNLQYFGEAPELAERVEKAITAVMAPAARELYGKPIIEPNVLYCNMLRPGEEIGTHSDVSAPAPFASSFAEASKKRLHRCLSSAGSTGSAARRGWSCSATCPTSSRTTECTPRPASATVNKRCFLELSPVSLILKASLLRRPGREAREDGELPRHRPGGARPRAPRCGEQRHPAGHRLDVPPHRPRGAPRFPCPA